MLGGRNLGMSGAKDYKVERKFCFVQTGKACGLRLEV